jgi:DNA-binding LytR/AlgR family response regulator
MGELMKLPAPPPFLKSWSIDLAIATALGVFVGLIGPFGSYFNGPLPQRVGFQVASFWLGTLLFGGGVRLLLRWPLPTRSLVAAVVLMTAVLTLPFSALISSLAQTIWPFLRKLSSLEWYLQSLVIAVPVALSLTLLIKRRHRSTALQSEAMASKPVTEGLLGVPTSQILCLQMEDHYVRAHTESGSRLILATMSQAIAAIEGNEGLQVHRSWWVARRAVSEIQVQGRSLKLRLVNGLDAPVARSAVTRLRGARWIE